METKRYYFWMSVFYCGLCVLPMLSHVDDGNVFGIYLAKGHLLIGDFWGACASIYCAKLSLDNYKLFRRLT